MYRSLGYFNIVSEATEASMNLGVHEIKDLTHYSESGEVIIMYSEYVITCVIQWVITDARHDSTANAFHTTVPCLSGRFVLFSYA